MKLVSQFIIEKEYWTSLKIAPHVYSTELFYNSDLQLGLEMWEPHSKQCLPSTAVKFTLYPKLPWHSKLQVCVHVVILTASSPTKDLKGRISKDCGKKMVPYPFCRQLLHLELWIVHSVNLWHSFSSELHSATCCHLTLLQ